MLHQAILRSSYTGDGAIEMLHSARPNLGRVLVVGDEHQHRNRIVDFLEGQGCEARGVDGQCDLSRIGLHGRWSLIIINVEQPAVGLERLRLFRAQTFVPILVTGTLGTIDRIVALELGADSCVARADDLQELWATAHAILRRVKIGTRCSGDGPMRGGFRFAGWEVNMEDRSLTSPSGEAVALTRTTYAVLVAFLEAPGRILSRAYLLRATRRHEDVFDRSVDIQIMRLREALKKGDSDRQFIRTERGVGYSFECDVVRYY